MKYYYINKLPKEYHRLIWDIMIIAESDVGLYMTLTKDIKRFDFILDKMNELEGKNKE